MAKHINKVLLVELHHDLISLRNCNFLWLHR